jgi:hypothetical protein
MTDLFLLTRRATYSPFFRILSAIALILSLSLEILALPTGRITDRNAVHPLGKEWVGGGGLIENEFVMVWQRRGEWRKPCLTAESLCQLNSSERLLLGALETEADLPPLLFRSFRQDEALSQRALGPENVVAVGRTSRDPLYINTDVLYSEGEDPLAFRGVQRPIRNLYAALLYLSGVDREASFQIAQKVAEFWRNQQTIHHLGFLGFPELTLSYFTKSPVRILVNDHNSTLEITNWALSQLNCGNGKATLLHSLQHAYWSNLEKDQSQLRAQLSGILHYECDGTSAQQYRAEFQLKLVFQPEQDSVASLKFSSNLSKLFTYYREPWTDL